MIDLMDSVVVALAWTVGCVACIFLLLVFVAVGWAVVTDAPFPEVEVCCYGTGCDTYVPLPPLGYPLGIR
ncbi:hypothetical protein [Phormidium sp. FACHB-1136]|uniref:hypothetical protein n=1 Tax=Phormidium sp. FACHB-1136 TaxID=2692848 RepID=UPI001689094F|nr:hypothetical protein [Phormidium sp. FACHB-1136]MBD2425254.1 hypothetical protein [Phormidium sp. FACHB-1136]